MSIALERSTSARIERTGLHHGMPYGTVYDSSESGRPVFGMFAEDRRLSTANKVAPVKNVVEDRAGEDDSTSSSSIGQNSDSSGGPSDGEADSGDSEVQSSYKGPLDALEALEEVLPIKRGMSKFYNGKSKSYASLADAASCSSIKDIVKPENAYTRKRKNLLAHSTFLGKNHDKPFRNSEGGLLKKPANSSRSNLAVAVLCVSNLDTDNNGESPTSNSFSPFLSRPPLYPHGRRSSTNNESLPSTPPRNFSPWRSFSLSDLQCAGAANPNITGLDRNNKDNDRLHRG